MDKKGNQYEVLKAKRTINKLRLKYKNAYNIIRKATSMQISLPPFFMSKG